MKKTEPKKLEVYWDNGIHYVNGGHEISRTEAERRARAKTYSVVEVGWNSREPIPANRFQQLQQEAVRIREIRPDMKTIFDGRNRTFFLEEDLQIGYSENGFAEYCISRGIVPVWLPYHSGAGDISHLVRLKAMILSRIEKANLL